MTKKQKQWQLYFLDYYTGKIDGIWGPMSKEATRQLQQDLGLVPDGVFGPKTTQATCELITALQKRITDGKLAIDGLAGGETQSALVDWQAANGLTPTGIADKATRAQILETAEPEPTDSWWDSIKHFARHEYQCKCGGRYCTGFPAEPKQQLVQAADKVRDHFGAPVFISSGVRCRQHNTNVGGVPGSRHRLGKAMDFRVEGKSAKKVLAYVKTLPEIRYCYAIDGSYVHMDVV